MAFATEALNRFNILKRNGAEAQARMTAVSLVRTGRANQVFSGIFPDDWSQPVVANVIDLAATDSAEAVGVLPTITALGDDELDESKRTRADRLTRIANAYTYESDLGSRLIQAADYLISYGETIFRIEPDYDKSVPYIHVDSPLGAFVERDRYNKISGYAKSWRKKASELAALYPEQASKLMPKKDFYSNSPNDRWLTLVKFYHADGRVELFIPETDGLILDSYEHPLGRVPVVAPMRPTLDGQPRGQYDDTLWVFAARARLALLNLEAAEKAVEAPLAVPSDVQEVAFGPDAVIRSGNPERIRRIPLEIPQSSMMESRSLERELQLSSRMPEARMGESEASVVTGRGVQALMGGFDSRIRTYQALMGSGISDALSMCLELDEREWGSTRKKMRGSINGTPYEVSYRPTEDIRGAFQVSCEYGLMAGMDANRSLVWGLQALGAGLMSKSFLRRNLPVALDVSTEERTIDVENLRDALMASFQAYAQAIPQMAASGQDPTEPVRAIATLIAERKKGVAVERAAEKIFAPKPPPPSASPEPGMPPEAGMAPEGAPALEMPNQPMGMQQLLAQLSGTGNPSTSIRTVTQRPVA